MNIDVAGRLYELRKKNNLSQEELAEKIGVSRQAVSKWERAEASPDTDNLILLSRLYNVSLDELLSTEEPVEAKPAAASLPETEDGSAGTGSWASFPYPIVVTIIYLLLGFTLDLWHPGWILFITIPIFYSLVGCRHRKHRS